MQKAIKQKSQETSLKRIQRQQTTSARNAASISPLANAEKNALAISHFQYHQKLKYPEIPSFPTSNDFEFKPLIRKSYFKCYAKESLSPIKSIKRKVTLTDNEFKEISQLIKIMNIPKVN